jgi:hypothetical protein
MIYKQHLGSNIYLGGQIKKITPLNWAVYNYGGTDSDIIEMSDNFAYFVITDISRYLRARAKAFWYNWKYSSMDGDYARRFKRTRATYKFAKLKARKELAGFKEEMFILPQKISYEPYKLDYLPNYNKIIPNDEELKTASIIIE